MSQNNKIISSQKINEKINEGNEEGAYPHFIK